MEKVRYLCVVKGESWPKEHLIKIAILNKSKLSSKSLE